MLTRNLVVPRRQNLTYEIAGWPIGFVDYNSLDNRALANSSNYTPELDLPDLVHFLWGAPKYNIDWHLEYKKEDGFGGWWKDFITHTAGEITYRSADDLDEYGPTITSVPTEWDHGEYGLDGTSDIYGWGAYEWGTYTQASANLLHHGLWDYAPVNFYNGTKGGLEDNGVYVGQQSGPRFTTSNFSVAGPMDTTYIVFNFRMDSDLNLPEFENKVCHPAMDSTATPNPTFHPNLPLVLVEVSLGFTQTAFCLATQPGLAAHLTDVTQGFEWADPNQNSQIGTLVDALTLSIDGTAKSTHDLYLYWADPFFQGYPVSEVEFHFTLDCDL